MKYPNFSKALSLLLPVVFQCGSTAVLAVPPDTCEADWVQDIRFFSAFESYVELLESIEYDHSTIEFQAYQLNQGCLAVAYSESNYVRIDFEQVYSTLSALDSDSWKSNVFIFIVYHEIGHVYGYNSEAEANDYAVRNFVSYDLFGNIDGDDVYEFIQNQLPFLLSNKALLR